MHASEDPQVLIRDLRKLAMLAVPLGIKVAYEGLSWGRTINEFTTAWDVVCRADAPNLGLGLDSYHAFATNTSLDGLDLLDARKIFLVQLAEMPDGSRYLSVARAVSKPSGRYLTPDRRYVLGFGCEIDHAREMVYADGLSLDGPSGSRWLSRAAAAYGLQYAPDPSEGRRYYVPTRYGAEARYADVLDRLRVALGREPAGAHEHVGCLERLDATDEQHHGHVVGQLIRCHKIREIRGFWLVVLGVDLEFLGLFGRAISLVERQFQRAQHLRQPVRRAAPLRPKRLDAAHATCAPRLVVQE